MGAPAGARNVLTTDDLIWPLFVVDGHNQRAGVPQDPGVERLSVDQVVREAERAVKLNIPASRCFLYRAFVARPSTARRRSIPTIWSANRGAIKKEFPGLGVLCDVALDPSPATAMTADRGRQDPQRRDRRGAGAPGAGAGEAGCDIIAPSDMMDGRVGAIREGWTLPDFSTCRSCPMRQNELRLLRPVPRRHRLGQDPDRRQAHLSDGQRQFRRSPGEVELDIAEQFVHQLEWVRDRPRGVAPRLRLNGGSVPQLC